MTDVNDLFFKVLDQYGLIGLIVFFLVTGPGYTYLRTKSLRAHGEAKAQELVNEFAAQERQRAERLEAQLDSAKRKLEVAEEEVAQMRLKLSESREELQSIASMRRQVRGLRKRVKELECQVEQKRIEIEYLRSYLEKRESKWAESTSTEDADEHQ
ncbi:MAG: hypothetical protein JNL42_18410 [Anaerolineae bacterium]|nr:hypothetical protein [Anaerolineae bacterium]